METDATDTVRLDVRSALAAGEEPFDFIMRAAADIPAGGTLEIIAPFEPAPLYAVMASQGFVSATAENDGAWTVRFTQVKIDASETVGDLWKRYPATVQVFDRHGIDLCCGDHFSLAAAAAGQGIPLDTLLDELKSAVADR